ncbi:hypothetical protein Vi05172_g3265 [Venturia inaequalis]|nr:hypothetical protein Vi05172_g3265 [Venturia inaequalis]
MLDCSIALSRSTQMGYSQRGIPEIIGRLCSRQPFDKGGQSSWKDSYFSSGNEKSSSVSIMRTIDPRPTVCIETHNSDHENPDSSCSFIVEHSDTDSEEELGTAVEAHYQRP